MLPRLMRPLVLVALACLLATASVGCLVRGAALEQETATHTASIVVSPTSAESEQVGEQQALTRLDWPVLKPMILAAIMDHFTAGRPMVLTAEVEPSVDNAEPDDDVVVQIKELIETRVRPAVAQDGGDIVFKGFEDGVVLLALKGSCAGCPSSIATLKSGIENMLKHYVPEVREVRQVA